MATQQELQEAFNLVALYSNASGDFGRDYGNAKSKAAKTAFENAGGQSRLAQLSTDPQIATELGKLNQSSGGFLSGLLKGIGTFVSESGVKESLMLGGAAMGLNAMGAFGSGGAGAATAAAPSATGMGAFTAEQLAAPVMSAGYTAPTIASGGGLLGIGSGTSEIAQAAQTLSKAGVSPEVIQQAATNPTLAQQISTATGIPTSILSNANAIIPLLAGGATLLGTNAPAQPDVNSLVGAQTAANKEMAQWNTLLANPNQVGPGGSSTYDQATNTFTQTLSPVEQALYEQRQGTRGQFGTLAGDAATRMGTTLAAPMPGDSEALRQQVIDAMMGRYKTDFDNREQQKISELRAAGINPGTAAYETEMNRMNQQYNDAMQQSQLAAGAESQRAYDMGMGTRTQAVNEATGLFGLGQAENPNTPISGFGFQPGATAQPVNSLAANQNQYAQNVGKYNANMQGGYGLLGLGLNQIGK